MFLCFIFQSGFLIFGLAVDFKNQSLFWSDTSAEFMGIPHSFMIHFSVWFPDPWISFLDFRRQPLFWSDTSPEFKGIPYGFMFYFSVWYPDPIISCRLKLKFHMETP